MFFAKAKTAKTGEIYIYESIGEGFFGGISAKAFADELKKVGAVEYLDIYMNSPGGSVFEGLAIYNALRRHSAKKTVYVDGLAASIASVMMLAGDNVKIASNGMVMIHDPWGFAVGSAEEMRKVADSLEKVRDQLVSTYVERTGNKKDQVEAWMSAETWFNAEEALKNKFVGEIITEASSAAAMVSPLLDKFANTPDALRVQSRSAKVRLASMQQDANKIRRASPKK